MNPLSFSVVFEGGEACGKATQSRMLGERLGAPVFSFPNYKTETGKAILGLLKGEWVPALGAGTAQFGDNEAHVVLVPSPYEMLVRQTLMSANRYEVACEIGDAMLEGPAVFDRYFLSSVVYGTVEGLSENWLWDVHAHLPQPRVHILLDASVEESFVRRPERRDLNERDSEKLKKVRAEYLRVFQEKGPSRGLVAEGGMPIEFIVIDGTGSIEEVHECVWNALCRVAAT